MTGRHRRDDESDDPYGAESRAVADHDLEVAETEAEPPSSDDG